VVLCGAAITEESTAAGQPHQNRMSRAGFRRKKKPARVASEWAGTVEPDRQGRGSVKGTARRGIVKPLADRLAEFAVFAEWATIGTPWIILRIAQNEEGFIRSADRVRGLHPRGTKHFG
jgi:hypothetical protein